MGPDLLSRFLGYTYFISHGVGTLRVLCYY
jgi:hypothetical protein